MTGSSEGSNERVAFQFSTKGMMNHLVWCFLLVLGFLPGSSTADIVVVLVFSDFPTVG